MKTVRKSVLDGSWYPADPMELTALVDGFLALADPAVRPAGRPLLAVVPHAGYIYSGPTAGKLLGLLPRTPVKRIVLLAPNHRAPLERIALSGAEAFITPLGAVATDGAAISRLAANESFIMDDRAHANEHAIEIQLPLIQRTWPDSVPRIIPMLVPPLSADQHRRAAAALALLADQDTLFLVSSDFTHYGASYGYVPFSEDIPAALERLDSGAILRILAADPAGLLEYGRQTGITMCGLAAAALALERGFPEGYEGTLIDYSRSGDRDGDYSLSVSYASILLGSGPDSTRAGERSRHD